MTDRLISGDNHIDLTYCPPDLWSAPAPAKWKLLVPRVEELEDGRHWFVDAQDKRSSGGSCARHPDCLWPESRRVLQKNLSGLPERGRRKITHDNVTALYDPR